MPANDELPEIDFVTFLLSLSTSAMIHLGDATDPSGGYQRNLPLARETIDIIALLEKKTRGNLTDTEEQLIKSQLYTLRIRYVDLTSGKG